MKKIRFITGFLVISFLFCLTGCDMLGGDSDKETAKELTIDEVMEYLAAQIYYTMHNADSGISLGAYGEYDGHDSGVPTKVVPGFKSGNTHAVGVKTRKYVSTGTYTEKMVDDSQFFFYFENCSFDDQLKLNSDYYWSIYDYHYEHHSGYGTSEVLPEVTTYYLFDCEYTLKRNSKTYTGKVEEMEYKTYLYTYYDNYLNRTVYSQDRYFNAYIKLTDGRVFNISGSNW